MAACQNSNERLFGGAVVLEVADGCPDTKPSESDWKSLAAGTSKGWDFNPNATTSDADDNAGYVESIITNADFTISFEGEVRKKDKLDQYGIGKFVKYFADELKARRQPGLWVRMNYGPLEFTAYMVITALSSDGGTNDIVTFSTEFKVGDASTVEVKDSPSLILTTDLQTALSVTAGQKLEMTIAASGGIPPYTYKWTKGGNEVSGQTTATFSKASAAAADAGVYKVTVTDSDSPQQVISSRSMVVTIN